MTDPMRYVLVGYPRGGTSMTMNAIDAGGVPVYRSEPREDRLSVFARQTYKGMGPNPNGYFEPDDADWRDKTFPQSIPAGMAVKMFGIGIARLSRQAGPFKVVHLTRAPKEIMQSYVRMFGRLPHRFSTVEDFWLLARTEADALASCNPVVSVTEMHYNDILANPLGEFERLAEEWPIDPVAAAGVVDADLYRNRERHYAAV